MVIARLGGGIFISAHITSNEVCEQAVRFCKNDSLRKVIPHTEDSSWV